MSFTFYDRVQSGQLISRANSDIRTVQMYLTFAPLDPRAVQHRCGRLWLHAVDQRPAGLVAMVADAVLYVVGVKMRRVDVPGLVDHPVPAGRCGDDRRREHQRRAGREVLRRREAARSTAGRRGRRVRGPTSRTPTSAPDGARSRTCPSWPRPRAAVRRVHGHPRPPEGRRHPRLQRLPPDAPGTFMMLGQLVMMGQRAASAAGGSSRSSTRTRDRRSAGRLRPGRRPGHVDFDPVDFAYGTRATRYCPTSTCISARARPWRSSGAPARASRPWRDCSPASTT